MDYTSRYGLDFNPFIKNSNEVVLKTSEYNEIIFRLNYLLDNKGFGVLTGEPGRGKTTAIRSWVKGLNTSLYKVVYSSLSTLTVAEFYKHFAVELGLEPMCRKTENFRNIRTEINRYALEKRITPVIIIDEANYINNGILNDLKMLFNFEMDSKDRAVVLLVGLPQLNNTLRFVANEPLRQRITMNYHLEGLSKTEAKEYILHKLKGANCNASVFEDTAVEAILNASNGIPRIINKLCNASLLIGNTKNSNIIDSDIVMAAVNEIELG
jgi:type II secretory pathway predicted ATPase ExeA